MTSLRQVIERHGAKAERQIRPEMQRRDDLAHRATEYVEGYSSGFRYGKDRGIEIQKRRQHRYAWGKLFLVVFGADLVAHLLFNLISMFV